MRDARESLECGRIGGDNESVGGFGGRRDLKIVRSPWPSSTARVRKELRVVAGDLEAEGDDLYALDRPFDDLAAPVSVCILGELDANK